MELKNKYKIEKFKNHRLTNDIRSAACSAAS